MNYRNYKLEDFLTDEFFVRWVKQPEQESDYFWTNWLKQNPEKVSLVERARSMILKVNFEGAPTEQETSAVLEQILANLEPPKRTSLPQRVGFNGLLKIAATISLLISGLWIWYHFTQIQPEPAISQVHEPVVKTTQKGQKLTINLPDGSLVRLNSESRLEVDPEFGVTSRNVHLDGEAYFEVATDKERPFNIQFSDLTVTVLGTSFNISGYGDALELKVAVKTGSVAVRRDEDSLTVLKPEQMLVFNPKQQRGQVTGFNDYQEFGWKDNILYFRNASYPEIKKKLERWFGVPFEAATNLKEEQFSGTFYNDNLERILEALNYTSKNQYQLNENKTIIKVKPK